MTNGKYDVLDSTNSEASDYERLVSSLNHHYGQMSPHIAERKTGQLIKQAAYALENAVPALDLLQARLENYATIEYQDWEWHLFDRDGEGICSGKTIREMVLNLIFTDC